MGQKDISEKVLEAYDDVFSDIINVLLFSGEEIIKPDELEDQAPRSAYKADGMYREMERDVAKRWKNENIRVACIGIENQTAPDPDMPLRILGYDGAEYRAQLNNDQKERYPVVTLVLYFGYNKPWDQPLCLKDRLCIPDPFTPFVNDYKINLFEIAFLDEKQVRLFKSDFRIVADYFVQKQKTGDYVASAEQLHHVQETLGLLSVMTNDRRFEEALNMNASSENRKEIQTMCDVLDRIEAKGIAIGEAKGIAIGEAKGIAIGEAKGIAIGEEEKAAKMAVSLNEQGVPISVIAKAADKPIEVIEKWVGLNSD